jgi:hydroxyacid-oxoacid transhydrogenase
MRTFDLRFTSQIKRRQVMTTMMLSIKSSRPIVRISRRSFVSTTTAGTDTTEFDTICELASSNLRFGPGSTSEVGQDLEFMKAKNVIVVTDTTVEQLPPMTVLKESLERHNIHYDVYNQVRVEPNDVSFRHAIDYFEKHKQRQGGGGASSLGRSSGKTSSYDAVIAIGGGSVIDTAKCANLYATHPPPTGDFYDYVNPPLGKGLPVPAGVDIPLIAIPTTAGTGSETTGVAIFDDTPTKSKTGIAHRRIKPTLGIVDPNNTRTMPISVATFSGLDVLCHAIESYTALPFNKRPKSISSVHRPAYQGSNPISDIWSLFALETTAKYLRRAVASCGEGEDDEEARTKMLIASSAAGMGFGNAGVHLCHGMSYAIASQVKQIQPTQPSDPNISSPLTIYKPDGYNIDATDHYLVPHGLSVIVNAPSVFEFTGVSDRDRHATCARILKKARVGGGDYDARTYFPKPSPDTGRWLADEIRYLMDDLNVPTGLKSFGYTIDDIPSLVDGTLPQHRVTKLSPRPVTRQDLEDLFLRVYNE